MNEPVGDDETANTMRERVRGGRPAVWFLVGGNRLVVSVLLLLIVYVLLILLSRFAPGSAAKLQEPDPIFALFTPVVIGIVMGVTLVLTFNQLVLSRELGPLGEQRERMSESMTFREDVEDLVERGTSPPEPSMFLRGLVDATGERAQAVLELVDADGDGSVPDEIPDYANGIVEDADRVSDRLKDEQFGEFGVVESALNYNYSWKIYTGRRLRNRHAAELSDELLHRYDELLDVLEFFGPAREHFKTLYFRWEIIDISRVLVYASLPALAVGAYMILVFQSGDVSGTTAGVEHLLLVVTAAFLVGLLPFSIFLSYILRIVTVAKWTLAIGPFVLRETDREPDIDWE